MLCSDIAGHRIARHEARLPESPAWSGPSPPPDSLAHSGADTQCHWIELIFLLAQRTDFCISKAVSLALFANMARHNTEVLAEAWLFFPLLTSGYYPCPSEQSRNQLAGVSR